MKIVNLTFVLACLLITTTLSAQDEKQKNYFQAVDPVEEENYTLSFENMVNKMDYAKLSVKIENTSSDYLLIKREETSFTINDANYNPKKKWFFIHPNKAKSSTYKVEDQTNYLVEDYELNMDGIYLVSSDGEAQDAPNFKLPASKNEMKFGDFIVKLKGLKKKTDNTVATFEVKYNGDDIAIVDGSALGVVIPDKGNDEFANEVKGGKAKLLKKGDKCSIKAHFKISAKYADMQFANMEILWRNTFQTATPEKLEGASVDFELDEALTKEKNK